DMVVNPSIGIHIIDDCAKKGVKRVILQPGASSLEIKKKAEALGIEAVDACVLVLLSWNREEMTGK
ncbi:MAG: CoA-binding protein, partial [Vallitaleaceae bacterium]|nr:CoA-binding protein [Vallitaleaceae bacterium]